MKCPQQLQSDLCAAGTTNPPQHCPPLPKLDILSVDANEEPNRIRKLKTTSRTDRWTHMRSKLLVKRKCSICRIWRCTSTPPKRNRGREWDVTQLASSGSISRKVAPKPHVYRSRLVCTEVRHQGVEPIFSATPPLETLRVLLCVACQEDAFRVEDPFLISIADASRAHLYANDPLTVELAECLDSDRAGDPCFRKSQCSGHIEAL